jgi:peptidoglycan/xylan/chitin deacetylase (PgdA/CDA1 family)
MLVGRTLERLWATRYPGFIFGRPLGRGEVPAFIYHEVEAGTFLADMAFLQDNGYRTLTTEEFVSMSRDGSVGQRAVLLTFDDARRNFFEVALPVLREFNARATVFVPTHWIDGRRNGSGPSNISAYEPNLFMTWEQIRRARDSGLVDVQSHAHRHALVYTDERLVGFASPELLERHHLYDWPMRREGQDEILGRPPLGTPVYLAEPLLSARRRILENPMAVQACRETVEAGGGAAFFGHRDWAKRLRAVHRAAGGRAECLEGGRFEALVASEFALSQELFEAELGYRPRFFAFPWMLGSERSVELAGEFGIASVFGVGLDYGRARRITRLPAFGRLKGDWLRCLPGKGRRRLWEIIPEKVKGFFAQQHLAH